MKLWQGRLPGKLAPVMEKFNRSLSFDYRLGEVDVRGSIAWAGALKQAGLLTGAEAEQIIAGLKQIAGEIADGTMKFHEEDEDVHSAVERRLHECIGGLAGKLHTGRSRNDQVATDFRLWVLEAVQRVRDCLGKVQHTLIERAEKDWGVVLPGYTHLQQAQPILMSHWWLSHFWALHRDHRRLHCLEEETRVCPLGSGALAGTGFPIDRFWLAQELGFTHPVPNSIDAVADRDFAAGLLFCMALIGVHVSRLAEMLILFSTREFGFITLADEFSTGSSLMPQKKNPDSLELARSKSGALTGRLMALLMTLKSLPSAYDKDLQEDKLPVFEACEIVEGMLPVLSGTIESLQVHPQRMLQAVELQTLATDMADTLVEKGIPFRQAHAIVGQAVRKAEELGIPLSELPGHTWREICPGFDIQYLEVINLENCLARRSAYGGTAPQAVQEQLNLAKQTLHEME